MLFDNKFNYRIGVPTLTPRPWSSPKTRQSFEQSRGCVFDDSVYEWCLEEHGPYLAYLGVRRHLLGVVADHNQQWDTRDNQLLIVDQAVHNGPGGEFTSGTFAFGGYNRERVMSHLPDLITTANGDFTTLNTPIQLVTSTQQIQ